MPSARFYIAYVCCISLVTFEACRKAGSKARAPTSAVAKRFSGLTKDDDDSDGFSSDDPDTVFEREESDLTVSGKSPQDPKTPKKDSSALQKGRSMRHSDERFNAVMDTLASQARQWRVTAFFKHECRNRGLSALSSGFVVIPTSMMLS